MDNALTKLTIKGFKSIASLEDFELRNLNVFIGANGTGKSNMIDFFRMLQHIMNDTLEHYINNTSGGINNLLFNGRKTTKQMDFATTFGDRGYRFSIAETVNERVTLLNEARYYAHGSSGWQELGNSHDGKSLLVKEAESGRHDAACSKFVYNAIKSWKLYQFHDTGEDARKRHSEEVQVTQYLRPDAANIAPYLRHLKTAHNDCYRDIIRAIQLAMPYFDDFTLTSYTSPERPTRIRLDWRQKGSDYPLQPSHFSDGSLRFICLVTALLQPEPPATLIIDEPELGLHPDAINIAAELINAASKNMQVIIATQSPTLVDHFAVQDIVVTNRQNGTSIFTRLQEDELRVGLEEYSLGDLWRRNIIPAGPTHE